VATGTGTDLFETTAPALVQQAVGAMPFGLLVAAADHTLVAANPAAEQLLIEAGAGGYEGVRCCDVLGCRQAAGLNDRCISELAAESPGPLPEVRLDLPPEQPRLAVWVSASRMTTDGSRIVIHLRRGEVGDRRRRTARPLNGGSHLRINGLGQTRVSVGGVDVGGDWLLQRPGELLRYMVCQRRRPVHVDEIVEALSPGAPADTGRNRTRHLIHVLRHRLEPGRARRTRSSFLSSVGSTYLLDPRVELDVEEFEEQVALGLRGPSQTPTERRAAAAALEHALRLYRGDLFSDDPYSPWIQQERERLRGLAYDSLVWLVQHFRTNGELDIVGRYLERGVALWPLDTKVHRALIDLHLEQGRRDAALRRYEILTDRMRRELGVAPDFSLAGLRSD
jgi:DNA-binding SARP family transcriptional activator